jgi:hypothetical protein
MSATFLLMAIFSTFLLECERSLAAQAPTPRREP